MPLLLPWVLVAALRQSASPPVQRVINRFDRVESKQLVPMLSKAIQFATYAGNDAAHAAQKAWLLETARTLGFIARDSGKIVEIELPAGDGAPILGLIVHGDVQAVEASRWAFPPFAARVADGMVYGRGAADDKGPLVQALLAMKALKESGVARTHTVRLLVGSEEESSATEIPEYLKTHAAPDYSLVLDSEFPVVVGEKAWNALMVTTSLGERASNPRPYAVSALSAGLATSIVPDRAELMLRWSGAAPDWQPVLTSLRAFTMPVGTTLRAKADGEQLHIEVSGRAAHAGVNLTGGRNALVALARLMEGKLPPGGADDLLAFARLAGQDLYGTGLGITDNDPLWGRYAVNVATVKPAADDPARTTLTINLRRIPPTTGPQLKERLDAAVADFNRRTGATLVSTGWYEDEPLSFNPQAKLVTRLMSAYQSATRTSPRPAISGGGTYAKRVPNAIAFGMWFPGKPYPGHDVDEKISIADLRRGANVLIYALVDIATGPRIERPFEP